MTTQHPIYLVLRRPSLSYPSTIAPTANQLSEFEKGRRKHTVRNIRLRPKPNVPNPDNATNTRVVTKPFHVYDQHRTENLNPLAALRALA